MSAFARVREGGPLEIEIKGGLYVDPAWRVVSGHSRRRRASARPVVIFLSFRWCRGNPLWLPHHRGAGTGACPNGTVSRLSLVI